MANTKTMDKNMRQAATTGKQAARQAEPLLELLARLGYAARGIVYVIIGYIALQAVNGVGSANVDQRKALQSMVTQPFGQLLLAVVAVGLFAYALWRLFLAIADPEGEGQDGKGIVKRIGYAITAISYGGFGLFAWQVMRGVSGGSGGPRDITAKIMGWPGGRWLVGVVGLALAAGGLYQIYQAYAVKFEKNFKGGELTPDQRRLALLLGRVGFAAKGLTYVVIGIFLVQAAMSYNPNKAGGLGDALQALAGQPYGLWLLTLTAVGLLAYGLYSLALAAFRRIQIRY